MHVQSLQRVQKRFHDSKYRDANYDYVTSALNFLFFHFRPARQIQFIWKFRACGSTRRSRRTCASRRRSGSPVLPPRRRPTAPRTPLHSESTEGRENQCVRRANYPKQSEVHYELPNITSRCITNYLNFKNTLDTTVSHFFSPHLGCGVRSERSLKGETSPSASKQRSTKEAPKKRYLREGYAF